MEDKFINIKHMLLSHYSPDKNEGQQNINIIIPTRTGPDGFPISTPVKTKHNANTSPIMSPLMPGRAELEM